MAEPCAAKLFGVTGQPVLHSRSPQLFQAAFDALGLPHRYLRLAARDATGAEWLADDLGLSAWNVTAPHKAAVATRVGLEGLAVELGAVNTVVRNGVGWRGLNTDPDGVVGALNDAGLDLESCRAVVLGAGGAGRAAAAGLMNAGARVTLVNRTHRRAVRVSQGLGCQAAPTGDLPGLLAAAGLLVVCLPAGVELVEPAWLHPGLTVLEADYAHGRLTDRARSAGCRVVDGADWLLHQARAGFEFMVGQRAPIRAMRAGLATPPPPGSSIALIGFMGAGKTTLGRVLAQRLGFGFVDLDAAVVQRAGLSIPELFAQRGEPAFRALEQQVLQDCLGDPRTVIACGGGLVTDPDNRRLLGNCLNIWLWCSLDVCLARVQGSDRPLLAGSGRSVRAARLLAERRLEYAACAALVVDAQHPPVEVLADRIRDEVHRFQDH